jgi:hypothetical protein
MAEILYNDAAYKLRAGVTSVTTTGGGHAITVVTGLSTITSCVANIGASPSTGGTAPACFIATKSTTPGSIVLTGYTYNFTATTTTSAVNANWTAVGS